MIILICVQGKSKFTSRKKNTKINILQIFSLKAQYIFHRNKYITIIRTIIWQHLYTQPSTIRKISGSGDAIHQYICVQSFAMILPGPQEYLPGYKRKCDISENNTQKSSDYPCLPLCLLCDHKECFHHRSDFIAFTTEAIPRESNSITDLCEY